MWAALLIEALTFSALGAGVYLLTRLLRFRRRDWPFADPRRAGIQAVSLVLLGWVLLTVYFVSVSRFVSLLEPHPSVRVFGARDIAIKLFRGLFVFGPVLASDKGIMETLASLFHKISLSQGKNLLSTTSRLA